MNVRGGLRFSVYFWHSEGWAPRNQALLEAVLKQAKTTRHPWLVACDAKMCLGDVEHSLWFQRDRMHVAAPNECRLKAPKGECDADVRPEDFEKKSWFQRELMHVVAPKEASTCRSKDSKGEWIERTHDHVFACHSLKGNFHR